MDVVVQMSGWEGHGGAAGVPSVAYRGMGDCFVRTVQEEGVLALFKGLWPNYIKVGFLRSRPLIGRSDFFGCLASMPAREFDSSSRVGLVFGRCLLYFCMISGFGDVSMRNLLVVL